MKRALPFVIWFALLGAAPAASQVDPVVPRLQALAATGSGEAAYHLGMIYHLGLSGVDKNPVKALEQFKLATERGDALGAYKLGCFYAGQGDGAVATDPELALRWKLVAAKAGYARAQEDVAEILLQRGDIGGALPWYETAARQGSIRALMTLSVIYDPDSPVTGTAKDRAKSYAYMVLLLNSSDRPEMAHVGAEIRAGLSKRMTAREIERAAALVRDWREERTPLTRQADLGMSAAEKLIAASTRSR